MEVKDLLSVIIPVYNVEKYLVRCLESVRKQTYTNLEIILVDDGSKDTSGTICDKYAKLDSRIKVVHQKNRGLSGARNRGMEEVTGAFVAFLDSDDWLEPDIYRKLIEIMQEKQLDIAACSVSETDGVHQKHICPGSTYADKLLVDDEVFEAYFHGLLYVAVWNKVYRRNIVEGIISPEPYQNEDNYVSGRYLFRAKRMMILSEVGHNYWINPAGITKSGKNRTVDICICVEKLINDLNREEVSADFLRKLHHKLAKCLYHFIRDKNIYYRVRAISNERLAYMNKYLDFRRKISFHLLLWKYRVGLY